MSILTNAQRSDKYEIELPDYKERLFFLGSNGSGKTVLASRMLRTYPRVFVLDVKYDFPIPWKRDYQILTAPPDSGLLNRMKWRFGPRRIIYRPNPPFDKGEAITQWFDWLFKLARKIGKKLPFIVYVDEGLWTSFSGAKESLARLAIVGRSIGLGLWVASQRPRKIAMEIRSEAWRYYVFFLTHRDDRLEICQVLDRAITEQELAGTTNDYQFWEIRRVEGGQQKYRLMPAIEYKG